jgi:hypothetical protein
MGARHFTFTSLTSIALSAVTAAAGSAATVAVDKPCYDESNTMTITGAGYTPGDTVDVTATGVFGTAPVDAAGQFALAVKAPPLGTIAPSHQAFMLTATSEANPTVTAAALFNVATFAVTTKPPQARPSQRVRFLFSGFTPGKAIYAHYVRSGKVRATARFGVAASPCGTLTVRARLYPDNHPATGVYHIQFDSTRRYAAKTAHKLVATLRIFKSFTF